MEKEKFIPPVVNQTAGLQLESAILSASQDFDSTVQVTGHAVETHSSDNYWE